MIWKKIIKNYPRDCFNKEGLFKYPPKIIERCKKQGIRASISSFLKKVISNQEYDFEFNNSSYVYDLLYSKDI